MNKTLYCPKCERNTRHYGEQQTPAGIRVMARLFTLGMHNASSYDMFCPHCGACNYTYEPGFDRFTWAREGTGVTVDRGLYSYRA
jgi:predicted nucleic-acid-binding Zn-ribbon protein